MTNSNPARRCLFLACGTCLALLGLGAPAFSQDKDKAAAADLKDVRPLVFVITGESNSGGLGENRAATAAELAPRPCVQIMNLTSGQFQFEDLKIGINNLREHRRLGGQYETTCHGFELELANAVAEGAFPGHDRVYLIKTGQGGSRVKDWNEDQQDWKTFVKRIEAGKKQLPADAQWVVWLSLGINDGLARNRNFQAEMRPYLDRVSKALPGAPIVMTGFQSMGYPEINKALAELSAERKGVSVIDSTGAKLVDANHWNYDGLKLVTRRLIAATEQSLKAQTPSAIAIRSGLAKGSDTMDCRCGFIWVPAFCPAARL